MKSTRHISITPARAEAVLIGNHKSVLSFTVRTASGFACYDVTLDNGLLLDMMDALKRGQTFERVTPS
jgi:hypothetical protein